MIGHSVTVEFIMYRYIGGFSYPSMSFLETWEPRQASQFAFLYDFNY